MSWLIVATPNSTVGSCLSVWVGLILLIVFTELAFFLHYRKDSMWETFIGKKIISIAIGTIISSLLWLIGSIFINIYKLIPWNIVAIVILSIIAFFCINYLIYTVMDK